jgi:serine/threonine protein kinase
MAPEIMNEGIQRATVDIWAVGVSVYRMLEFNYPFEDEVVPETNENLVFKNKLSTPDA